MTSAEFPARQLLNKPTTVFVIGAGVHCDIGMPTGEELRDLIIGNRFTPPFPPGSFGHGSAKHAKIARMHDDEFLRVFSQSSQYSIDRFLECDAGARFHDLGRMHLSHAILQRQSEAFSQGRILKSWYRWMYANLFESTRDLSDIECSFISFNYDTCFESLLAIMHSTSHGIDLKTSINATRNLSIHHVYGSLDVYPVVDNRSRQCVMPDTSMAIANLAKGIRLIGDRESPEEQLSTIRSVIRAAEVIVFLGFSFDPRNLARIGFDQHDEFWGKRPSPQCFGTCMGIASGRLRRIEQSMAMPIQWARSERDCRGLLETLFIH